MSKTIRDNAQQAALAMLVNELSIDNTEKLK